jgi:hypothetical protein
MLMGQQNSKQVKKGVINYEKLLKGDIFRYRIGWNNEFDRRHNHGYFMVVFRITMVVYSLWISRGVFLN